MTKTARLKPGAVRDGIVHYLRGRREGMAMDDILAGVEASVGQKVPRSSVRSYLNLNTDSLFERTSRGHYRLRKP